MSALSKYEQKLIDRLKAAGYPVRHEQSDATFGFLIRPYATVEVASKDLAHVLEHVMFKSVSQKVFESPITGIAIFPKIIDKNVVEAPKDKVTFKRKERSVFVTYDIDYEKWQGASRSEKLDLLVENVKRSLEGIPSKYLLASDADQLFQILDAAKAEISQQLLHE